MCHFLTRQAITLSAVFFTVVIVGYAVAQPRPGDVFREYGWTNEGGDADGTLRVGGRLDYGGGPIVLPHDLDLVHATRAEVVVEKLLCHDGTRGLAISVNDHPWIQFPEAPGIPEPQWEYQHHTYPVVEVPLEQLHSGPGNQFRLKVSQEHPWNWPQHLIYGVVFRIYYDAKQKAHPVGRLVRPQENAVLGRQVELCAEASSPNGEIRQVDFLGRFEDVNLEGDGCYVRWHYRYFRSQLTGHIGSATSPPYTITWDTSWVPDQPEPFQLAARIVDVTGLILFTEAVGGLTFDRGGLRVELCKPYDVPKKWVTRAGEFQQKLCIVGNPTKAVAARLVWCSWSPGYMNGIDLNGHRILDREGPRYAYYIHNVPIPDLSVLRPGENVITTGRTPLHNGKMVHGMEVNWPGIMLLIQYEE